jgi:hypothetical protein
MLLPKAAIGKINVNKTSQRARLIQTSPTQNQRTVPASEKSFAMVVWIKTIPATPNAHPGQTATPRRDPATYL